MRGNNAWLIKQFCSIKLHFIDYQSVLFDKTGGNNQLFFLILSNKNKTVEQYKASKLNYKIEF